MYLTHNYYSFIIKLGDKIMKQDLLLQEKNLETTKEGLNNLVIQTIKDQNKSSIISTSVLLGIILSFSMCSLGYFLSSYLAVILGSITLLATISSGFYLLDIDNKIAKNQKQIDSTHQKIISIENEIERLKSREEVYNLIRNFPKLNRQNYLQEYIKQNSNKQNKVR